MFFPATFFIVSLFVISCNCATTNIPEEDVTNDITSTSSSTDLITSTLLAIADEAITATSTVSPRRGGIVYCMREFATNIRLTSISVQELIKMLPAAEDACRCLATSGGMAGIATRFFNTFVTRVGVPLPSCLAGRRSSGSTFEPLSTTPIMDYITSAVVDSLLTTERPMGNDLPLV